LNSTLDLRGSGAGLLTISSGIVGNGGLTTASGSVYVLSGQNSYTGGTTLNGGVLRLASLNALPASGQITFNGGTLALNNQDLTHNAQEPGALTLNASSSILLDPANTTDHGVIRFTAATWVGGTLSIFGWTGAAGGPGSDDRIYLQSNPGPNFLQHVDFYSGTSGGLISHGAQLGTASPEGYMELEPIATPEPTNIALVLFGSGFAIVQFARRQRGSRNLGKL
jgi:fibronectin-binding autotransporter adhesin